MPRDEFVSERIEPAGGWLDVAGMGRGEPGLPRGFLWRGESFEVISCEESWKTSSPEGGRVGADVYLRRHYYRLKMANGTLWTVYFLRQAARAGSAKHRWFLYAVESA